MASREEEKKKTIVKEIEGWRRSKLLPEQYCDFLTNLYLDDLDERPKGAVGAAVRRAGQATGKQWLLVIGIFALICLLLLHFSAFPLALQIALAGCVSGAFVWRGARNREANSRKGLILVGAGAAFLFGSGFGILRLHGWGGDTGTAMLIGSCSLACIACGIALKYAFIHWLGWMGIAASYALLLSKHVPGPSWIEVQVFWIPAALLFVWLSWFMHVRFKSAGTVFFAMGLVLWFMPEIYSALLHIGEELIQLGLLIKIFIAGFGMFRLRKQWMEWVA